MDLTAYRHSERERLRLDDLLRLLPNRRGSLLEIGARDGYHSGILAGRFDFVVAIDLQLLEMSVTGVSIAQASVTALPFRDNAFDCVLCAEVLEHVPELEKAAAEISRVTRGTAVIGVPFRQDTRVSKLTCGRCGEINPPYGHVNTFDEGKLRSLFRDLDLVEFSFVGTNTERTSSVASWLMTKAGNPWAPYDQDEPCIFCGSRFERPPARTIRKKIYSSVADRLNRVQRAVTRPLANWIHAVFRKPA